MGTGVGTTSANGAGVGRRILTHCRAVARQLLPPIITSAIQGTIRSASSSSADHCEWRQIAAGPLRGYWLELDESVAMWTGRMDRGEFEIPTTAALEETIQPGWTCFDIGAHVGYHTMLMAKLVGPNGAIHAFEPLPQNVERIQKHVSRNGHVELIQIHSLALSDRAGTAILHGADRLATSSGGYLESARPAASAARLTGFRDIPVEQQALDYVLDELGIPVPQLIKLDVEGAEVAVLRGAAELIRTHKPFLIIEFHNAVNAVEGMQFLQQAGYETRVIDYSIETCSVTAQYRPQMVEA